MEKKCSGCDNVLPHSEFYKDSTKADGLHSICKTCRKVSDKSRYEQKRNQILEQKRQYYQQNKDERLQKNAEWRKQNRDHLRLYGKKKAARSVDYQADYRLRNREVHRVMYQAKKAVSRAVERGELAPVKTLACAECGEQASNYHHPSYARSQWLTVVPLCRSCHSLVHVAMRQKEYQQ